jgi:PBP1b-binding outer membrane lipoprotein LpoB
MRRASVVLAIALFLAGCSGTVSTPPTPTPVTPELSIATQRIQAQATIVVTNGIQVASLLAALVNAIVPRSSEAIDAAAQCKNGVETTVVQKSPETFEVTIDVFYDSQCTTRLSHALLNVGFFGLSKFYINGTQITYAKNGKATSYAKLTNTTTLGAKSTYSVTQGTVALSQTGPSVLSFGLSCNLAQDNDCGFGGVVSIGSSKSEVGVEASLHNFVASGKSTNGLASLNAFQGKPGSLKLVQEPRVAWRIVGGTAVAALSGTFDENVNAQSFDVTGSVALHDDGADASTSDSFGTRTGIAGGKVVQSSTLQTFASFAADATGTGSIHYSNGSIGHIAFFIITS